MKIIETAFSGTLESGDIQIEIRPGTTEGIQIDLESPVMREFGEAIRDKIHSTLNAMGISSANIYATDHGALDCTVAARVQTAAMRASGETAFHWEAKCIGSNR